MSGRTFLEKNLFHKFSYFHESFRTLGEKNSKLCLALFGRAVEKATYVSGSTLWRKTKCFRERCFFYKCFRTLIGKVCTFEENNCLGSKTSILGVLRNVLGGNFCIKNLFLVKFYRTLREFFSDFRLTCFRQGCHHSILLLPRKVSGKFFPKKKFFSLFPDLEQKLDYWKNIKLNLKTLFYVSGGIFVGKT